MCQSIHVFWLDIDPRLSVLNGLPCEGWVFRAAHKMLIKNLPEAAQVGAVRVLIEEHLQITSSVGILR